MVWIRQGVAAVPRVRVSGRLDEHTKKKKSDFFPIFLDEKKSKKSKKKIF